MPAAETAKGVLVAGEINVDLICQGYHAFPTPGREVLVTSDTVRSVRRRT